MAEEEEERENGEEEADRCARRRLQTWERQLAYREQPVLSAEADLAADMEAAAKEKENLDEWTKRLQKWQTTQRQREQQLDYEQEALQEAQAAVA